MYNIESTMRLELISKDGWEYSVHHPYTKNADKFGLYKVDRGEDYFICFIASPFTEYEKFMEQFKTESKKYEDENGLYN